MVRVLAVDRSTEGASRRPVTPPPADSSESLPIFTKLLTDILAVQNDTVTFECTVGGSPLPTVTWFHNNNDLNQSDRIHVSLFKYFKMIFCIEILLLTF